jgi:hypothetical protein
MFAVVGRVRIKPGQEELTRQMVSEHGAGMFSGMAGSRHAYWSRSADGSDLIQHSFWLFDTEENAFAAQATFNTLREMTDAPAEWVSCDVCEVIGEA